MAVETAILAGRRFLEDAASRRRVLPLGPRARTGILRRSRSSGDSVAPRATSSPRPATAAAPGSVTASTRRDRGCSFPGPASASRNASTPDAARVPRPGRRPRAVWLTPERPGQRDDGLHGPRSRRSAIRNVHVSTWPVRAGRFEGRPRPRAGPRDAVLLVYLWFSDGLPVAGSALFTTFGSGPPLMRGPSFRNAIGRSCHAGVACTGVTRGAR